MPRPMLIAALAMAAGGMVGRARSAPPAPGQPALTVGEHSVAIEHISEHQTVTRPLTDAGPGAESAAQHRVSVMLRVGSPNVSTTAVDRFVGDFTLVSNTGQTLKVPNEDTVFNTGSPTIFVSTEELEIGAQSLRSVSGRLRVYPRGEKVRVNVEPRTGAEGKHKNGLTVRVTQASIARDRIVLDLTAEWPATLSLRGEADEEAFELAAELPQHANPVPIGTGETPLPPVDGRRRSRIQTTLAGLASPIRSLIIEAVARDGKPVDHPFTFRDVTLPLYMADTADAATRPATAGIPVAQQVLVNGKPAGPGVLEIGIASRRRGMVGPWRWERLTTDDQGRTEFRLPRPGEYRVERRWRPADERRRSALAGVRWDGARLDLQAVAGMPVRMGPLATTGAVNVPAGQPEVAVYEAAVGPYRVSAARVQERAQSLVQFGTNEPRPRPRSSRYTTITLTATAPDPVSRAALEAVSVTDAVEGDGRTATPYSVELTRGPADNPNSVSVAVVFRGLGIDWQSFRTLEGELAYFPRARLLTADLPLGPDNGEMGPLGEFREGDLLLRAFRDDRRDPYSYRVAVESPVEATLMLLADQGQPPVLLNDRREPARTPLRSQPRVLDNVARELRASFVRPDTAPAFLRVPLVIRHGQPERRAFQLSGIPLPLSVASKPPSARAAP